MFHKSSHLLFITYLRNHFPEGSGLGVVRFKLFPLIFHNELQYASLENSFRLSKYKICFLTLFFLRSFKYADLILLKPKKKTIFFFIFSWEGFFILTCLIDSKTFLKMLKLNVIVRMIC